MTLSERITTETLRRIASSEEYEENEILCVAEYLSSLYEYDFERQFGLVNVDNASRSRGLQKLEKLQVNDQKPFFGIYSNTTRHWSCFAVAQLRDHLYVLYKDSFGKNIPHELRESIGDRLRDRSVRFDSHRGTEQSDGNSSGPICLRNLQVLMKGLKSEIIKAPLIEKFQKVRFCTQYGVLSVKREFRLWLQKYLLSGLEEVATELVQDSDYESFCKDLCSFLESCSKLLKETFVLSSTYTSLLKTEAKKKDQDPRHESDHKTNKAMKEARDVFYRNSEVQKSLKCGKDDFIDLEDGARVYNLEIQEKYPEQMQKFTKIFAVLAQAEMNEELERALRRVSQMLNLEFDKIKIYFEQQKIPRRPDFMRAEFTPPNTVGTLEKAIEVIKKSKSKTMKESLKADSTDKKIKQWDQLLSELVLDARGSNPNEAKAQLEEIRSSYPKIQAHQATWATRGVAEISMWANACRAEEKPFESDQLLEAIAVLDRANELATGGHKLRAPQILAVLVFLGSGSSNHGKLCQIESGEGKTVIVSLLATMMILQGEKSVDVITSNAILAEEGVESRKLFYSLFNISVATNVSDKNHSSESKKCYLADVVYGSISDFQFDYLRDTAEGMGTMCGRQFCRVILDEVDNMLVDNGRHIAKISSPFPGMENLKYIYLRIWNELLSVESQLVEDFQEKLNEHSSYTKSKDMAVREFLKIFDSSMIGRMEERIKTNLEDLDMRFVPTHCLKYAESMIPKWIGNAVRARYFIRENEQYSLKESNGELAVVPVDYSNTGVTLKNTVWSYGLHQFVQIKHNLRITPESLTSSCVSNYAFIGKYLNKIFGLTGTLGSRAEQDLLSAIYNVDYARLPTYKKKIFVEYPGVAVPDDDWSFEVALMSVGMIRSSGRAVLIICKTIADLLILEEQLTCLKEHLGDSTIRLKRFQDEETSHVTRETVSPGDVIVATNIAGRGADFKTSRDLERNGGLHVCVGFCPDNERVREQAFFRTSRQGNLGSAQLVCRESEIRRLGIDTSNLDDLDFDEVKRRIEIIERDRLNDIKHSKLDVLRFEDALFTLFSDMCQELKNNNVITWGHSYLMKDLKEYWAFWLENQDFDGRKYSLKEASFTFFKFKNDEKTRRIVDGSISHNPYYGVLQSDFFLKNDEVDKAKASLINAICLSKNTKVMYPAFLTLFDATLEEKGPLMTRFRAFLSKVFSDGSTSSQNNDNFGKTAEYTAEIIEYLTIAHAGLGEEIEYLESNYLDDEANDDFRRLLVAPAMPGVTENLLIKHLVAKLTCLKLYQSNAETLLETFEGSDSQKLAITTKITDYLKNFEPDTREKKQTRELMTDPEIMELGSRGLKTVYGLKKLSDIPSASLEKAKSQILGALALMSRASAFPPLTFAVANVVSVMVAEAIALVVLTLFKETNNIDDQVKKSEYLKGKALNYVVSLISAGNLNADVCLKVFLRMVRCYRESYYLLEHSTDDVRLLKNIKSTEIAQTVSRLRERAKYDTWCQERRIKVPRSLAQQLFEADLGATVVGQIAEFEIEEEPRGIENGNGNSKEQTISQENEETVFFNAAKDSPGSSKLEYHLARISPKKFGGSYEALNLEFSKIECNSIMTYSLPCLECLKDTPYASINESHLPAIAMLERDYRALQRLRFTQTSAEVKKMTKGKKTGGDSYLTRQKGDLEKGEFWKALESEITEILAVSKFYETYKREFANYAKGILSMMLYCKNADIPDVPEISSFNVPKGHLISQEQYDIVVNRFKLRN
ncbi:hypothetical protein QAD02_006421 [Eretmocerus hayati]|uniref:Uncharacterized protein n=1 Tax=Eretmocerus hayati TaxID=131215 RepID=A0ACC2N373_9HYME|nr:hypothetical protein QAD02_006421 [Eretmocerus hayati]